MRIRPHPTSWDPYPPFEPGPPRPTFLNLFGRGGKGQVVPARAPARGFIELWPVWAWEHHERGPPLSWGDLFDIFCGCPPFWKTARKTSKKTRISYACRTPKIFGKERKNAQNRKGFLEKEKGKKIQKGKEKKIRERNPQNREKRISGSSAPAKDALNQQISIFIVVPCREMAIF